MFTSLGVGVDAWVSVEGQCPITYEAIGEQAQLRFGGARCDGLTIVLTEQALEKLMVACDEALRALRGEPAPAETV